MEKEDSYSTLLHEKKELVFKLLRLSNDASFNDTDCAKNAEKYISFTDSREAILNSIRDINSAISQLSEPAAPSAEHAQLEQEINGMLEQAVRLESDINKHAEVILDGMREEIKKININKKIRSKY